jgi:hypothetical protein
MSPFAHNARMDVSSFCFIADGFVRRLRVAPEPSAPQTVTAELAAISSSVLFIIERPQADVAALNGVPNAMTNHGFDNFVEARAVESSTDHVPQVN